MRRLIARLVATPLLLVMAVLCVEVAASEKTTIAFAGKQVACEVVRFLKGRNDEVQMQLKMSGVEQTLPLRVFAPEDVRKCYTLAMEPKNAPLRLGMGDYFYGKEMFSEAEVELKAVIDLDPKLKAPAESLLQKILTGRSIAKIPETKVADKKPETPTPPTPPKKREPGTGTGSKRLVIKPDGTITLVDGEYSDDEENGTMLFGGKGGARLVVPPLSEEKMKVFLDKRLQDLKDKVGGDWRMIETKHYYCFANIPKEKHQAISMGWNEGLYDVLARILEHKEGDKLWNNKMPIYYFQTFKQFQQFAVKIDQSPGAQYSGGYFMPHGREVHICIPFMTDRFGDNTKTDERARATMYHEGTHAFLQLTGEDVELARWLHEGMAQFMEFWLQPNDSSEKKSRISELNSYIQQNRGIPEAWSETDDRPRSGMDHEGYCYAWSKFEFFFRHPNKRSLPNMIRAIKEGKTEKEAMEKTFGIPQSNLENAYRTWVKEAIKIGFKFN